MVLLFGDEMNLVEPGFNSGWSKSTGNMERNRNYNIQRKC